MESTWAAAWSNRAIIGNAALNRAGAAEHGARIDRHRSRSGAAAGCIIHEQRAGIDRGSANVQIAAGAGSEREYARSDLGQSAGAADDAVEHVRAVVAACHQAGRERDVSARSAAARKRTNRFAAAANR